MRNIIYLVIVQGAIYLAPLLMLPYLTRLLPVADFAAMVAAQAFVQYFVLVTDYGFTITATRQIVFARDDHQQVSRIYSATMSAKLLLAAGSMLICMLLTLTIPALRLNPVITLACMIGILGNALFPMWLLQGLERMKHLALMTAISRFLPLPVLLLLVTRPDQAVLAALIVNSPAAIGAVFGLAYVRKHRLAVWHRVDLAAIRYQLSEGWAAFIGGMATSFYTTMNVLLLNGFSTPQQVSYFNASDKIRSAAQGFIQPVAAALFPKFSLLAQQPDPVRLRKLMQMGTAVMLLLQLAGGLVMYFGAELIARYYLGAGFAEAAWYLRSLAFLPLVIAVATILSQWRLLACGESRALSKIYIFAGPLHLLYAAWMTREWGAAGLVLSLFITEGGITLAMLLLAKKKRIPLY